MKSISTLALAFTLALSFQATGQTSARREKIADPSKRLDTRVDNNGYWKRMAAQGLTKLNGVTQVPPASFNGSEIRAFSVITEDSPDVPVAPGNSTQSENSVFVSPLDNLLVINSNNSSQNPLGSFYGANALESDDGGLSWGGTVQGAGGYNSGDPVALIGLDGSYYIGFISESGGQAVGKSTDGGATYTVYNVANAGGGGLLDKNHLWIDNNPTSPFEGTLYDAWTDFYGAFDSDIGFSRSINGGVNWSAPINVSSAVNAGSHCQGVNINSGPYGEVYVIWAIYDTWPQDETSIGMARSFDGGATFGPATRIISNIRGIRSSGISKNMRNNSFPSMAVDISGGEFNGNIYIVWSNIGVPGINTGSDVDVYMIRSEDQGVTWSAPIRVNQDPTGLGSEHYFPWITCDPETGDLSVIFYDDRNVGGNQCEVYCANSYDGGVTWEDFKVSDVAFTPTPIPGLADGYMGDYIGINARGGWVYPTWADTRTGSVMTYVSPYQTNPLARPTGLTAEVEFETGIASLEWTFLEVPGFTYFNIYRDNVLIGTSADTVYTDQLPGYGIYNYKVSAYYEGVGESSYSHAGVQWGDAQISVAPASIVETLQPDQIVTRIVTVDNIGQLEMDYHLTLFVPGESGDDPRAYCSASGGCDEFISRVRLNEIDNSSNCTGYGNYTTISTSMSVGNSYEITITNGNPIWPEDRCGLWVDWDQDEEFDENESIPVNGSPGVGPYTATISPPVGSLPGSTRLRTRIVYSEEPVPCGNSSYGEAEDYTVFVQSWLFVDPMSGNIEPGGSMEIEVTMNSTDMALGTYTAELQVYSNDPDDPMVIVPITMHVADIGVYITADDESICLGQSAQLTSEVIGGPGNYTYSWISVPEGFTSGEANPVVTPSETTTYHLVVTGEEFMAENQITIHVNPLPQVSLGEDVSLCLGESHMLTPGADFETYLWSDGSTGSSITVSDPGNYWVEVTDENGCAASDTLEFNLYPLPELFLGEDNNICEGGTLTLDAGSDFSTYTWSTGETSHSITVSQPGTYWINITDMNGCEASDTIQLGTAPMPLTTSITSGPASVDNFLNPTSTYTCSDATYATTYVWTVNPSGAGTTTSTGTSAEISWTPGYTGPVEVAVTGKNDCGQGPVSGIFTTEVYSSQGMDEKNAARVIIYPNPGKGLFNVQIPALANVKADITVTDVSGSTVYQKPELSIPSDGRFDLNLSSLPDGSYTLNMKTRENNYQGKLILQRN